MARGQRKTIEEKIREKEELVGTLKVRLKAEQNELDALCKEKRDRELEGLNQLLEDSGLNLKEASGILQEYIENHKNSMEF